MNGQSPDKDLMVIVPDGDMEFAVEALLCRPESLGMRPISFDIRRHLQRDSGCRSDCHHYLRPWLRGYGYAMVLFDHEGCGKEELERTVLEEQVEAMLRDNGWNNRCAVIVIAPELEAWVWSDSPVVDEVLGWQGRTPVLRDWVRNRTEFWPSDHPKPNRPKEAFEAALKEVRKQRSPRLFKDLASRVSVSRCIDPSLLKFRDMLAGWFPKHEGC